MSVVRNIVFYLKTIHLCDPTRSYHAASIITRLPQKNGSITSKLMPHKSFCSEKSQTPNSFDKFRAGEELKEEKYTKNKDQIFSELNNKECNDEHTKVSAVKDAILNAALPFVSTNGWSLQAISKGAESLNYSSISSGLFPKGGVELVLHFYKQCNDKLLNYLKKEASGVGEMQHPTEFARKAIELRLRMLTPFLGHWPQALGLMALPPNAPVSLTSLLSLVDDICYYSGDRSVDFNWYIRRIGLAGVYKSTELYMLQDKSTDFEKTWKFLDQRMEDAVAIQNLLVKSESVTTHVQNAAYSVLLTTRSILGLNFNKR